MRRRRGLKILLVVSILLYAYAGLPLLSFSKTSSVKTSFKRYSIFKYKTEDILCEPYTVKKDDWLYKIFRKKGEISEKDFPLFLFIFKEINPDISNIDAIEPGINILIPLKKVIKDDYDQSSHGTINVPVVEFSSLPEETELSPYLKKHSIQKGETVSTLIDKDFLQKNGSLSDEGLKIFRLANPHIKNIQIIYEGTQIYLPDASIKSQPWFQSFLSGKSGPSREKETLPEEPKDIIDTYKLAQLKRYSALIGGILLNQGNIYFPGPDNSRQILDLSHTPLIETEDGSKILILSGRNMNDELLKSIQTYWKDLKTQYISEILETAQNNPPAIPPNIILLEHKKLVETLLSQTDFEYIPDARIPFMINQLQLEASFGRIIQKDTTDLLINFGNVYGSALDALEKREFKILSITPKLSSVEVATELFAHLGYSTWMNPSFSTGVHVEKIEGVYCVKDPVKFFVPAKPLTDSAVLYLKKEGIKILSSKVTLLPSK